MAAMKMAAMKVTVWLETQGDTYARILSSSMRLAQGGSDCLIMTDYGYD